VKKEEKVDMGMAIPFAVQLLFTVDRREVLYKLGQGLRLVILV
jgi:hypothetical protein